MYERRWTPLGLVTDLAETILIGLSRLYAPRWYMMINTLRWHLIGLLMAVLKLIPGHRKDDGEATEVSLGPLRVWHDYYYGLPYEARIIFWGWRLVTRVWLDV